MIASERIGGFETKRSQRISCDWKIKGIMLGLHNSKNCILRKQRIVKNLWNRMELNYLFILSIALASAPGDNPIKPDFRPWRISTMVFHGDGGDILRIHSIGMHTHPT